jgi:alkylation response protein AidB-like acyl-CoA dehydrogenase
MFISYTPGQLRFRTEVRDYFQALMTPEVEAALASVDEDAGPAYREIIARIGRDGWLTVHWPAEYGGRGLSRVESYISFDETARLGVPIPVLTTNSVGPAMMRHGTDEQRARFLPGIARGDIHFSIGYSEPESGTDLASLRTHAERDGDEYVVNGQKMWTSLIHHADYVWLAVRTDRAAPPHRGISVLIVPTDAPGFSWTPVPTLRGGFTSATYYREVRVPAKNLVGELNGGWRLITDQLNAERVAISPAGIVTRKLDEVLHWARDTPAADGRRVIDQEWVQLNLARVRARLEYLTLLSWKVAAAPGGTVDPVDASALKVYGSELYIEAVRLLMEVIGPDAILRQGSAGAFLHDSLEAAMRWNLVTTFGGGTNEIQRDIIARAGLNLPREPR